MEKIKKGDPTITKVMYCVKCRTKVVVTAPESVTMKSGRPALRGKCPDCNTVTYMIVAKDKK